MAKSTAAVRGAVGDGGLAAPRRRLGARPVETRAGDAVPRPRVNQGRARVKSSVSPPRRPAVARPNGHPSRPPDPASSGIPNARMGEVGEDPPTATQTRAPHRSAPPNLGALRALPHPIVRGVAMRGARPLNAPPRPSRRRALHLRVTPEAQARADAFGLRVARPFTCEGFARRAPGVGCVAAPSPLAARPTDPRRR